MKRSMRRWFWAVFIMLGVLPCGSAQAEGLGSASLPDTYSCYFITPFSEIFNSEITFTDQNGLNIEIWTDGDGYYLGAFGFFAGVYVAVDAVEVIEEADDDSDLDNDEDEESDDSAEEVTKKDLVMTLFGYTIGPYMVGTGQMILDYSKAYSYVFYGILADLGN